VYIDSLHPLVKIVIAEDKYALREHYTAYSSVSSAENSGLRIKNVFYWDES
jgi:hypothetical protein